MLAVGKYWNGLTVFVASLLFSQSAIAGCIGFFCWGDGGGGGGDTGGAVPEIDGPAGIAAIALLAGALRLAYKRAKK